MRLFFFLLENHEASILHHVIICARQHEVLICKTVFKGDEKSKQIQVGWECDRLCIVVVLLYIYYFFVHCRVCVLWAASRLLQKERLGEKKKSIFFIGEIASPSHEDVTLGKV